MTNSTKEEFLLCRNCVNWGQAWRIGRTLIVCSEQKQENGEFYSAQSAACSNFVPIQGELPPELQRMRLMAQTLSPREFTYLRWALGQRALLLNVRDTNNEEISLGDYVQFKHRGHLYVGSVEGLDPSDKAVVVINCPAFPNATISLVARGISKISLEEASEKIRATFTPAQIRDLEWSVEAFTEEIVALRARGLSNLSSDDMQRLQSSERGLLEAQAQLDYNAVLLNSI